MTQSKLPTHTRVGVINRPGRVDIETRALPELGLDDLLIKVEQNSLCGSDADVFAGNGHLPMVVGHEFGGVIVAAGADVRDLRPRTRVTAWVPAGCGLADYAVVKAAYCAPLAQHVANAAAGEPLACCINILRQAPARAGQRVVLVGGGYMTNLLVMLLRRQRIIPIVAARRDYQREAARRVGAKPVDIAGPAPQAVLRLREALGGQPADVVYELTGKQAGLDLADGVLGTRSTLAIAGYHLSDGGQRTIPLARWNALAIEIKNTHFASDPNLMVPALREAAHLMNQREVNPAPLVTHRFPFTEQGVAGAFAAVTRRREGFMKALITMDR